MKVSEEQYDKYGQILEQFLEDILAEDTKGNILWFKAKRFKNLPELKTQLKQQKNIIQDNLLLCALNTGSLL